MEVRMSNGRRNLGVIPSYDHPLCCTPMAALASSSTAASPEHLHLIPALPGDSDSRKQKPLPVSDGEARQN